MSTNRFANGILYWKANRLPGDWKNAVVKALSEIDEVQITEDQTKLVITVRDMKIALSASKSTGVIQRGDGDFMAGLILLRLEKFLSISIADDAGNDIDNRKTLKSVFIENGLLFAQGEFQDEFDQFTTNLGLLPQEDRAFLNANPVVNQFF